MYNPINLLKCVLEYMKWGNSNIYFSNNKKYQKYFAYNNFETLIYKEPRVTQKYCDSVRLHCINNALIYDVLPWP